MSTLKNKTALITGGNSGIGYSVAKELTERGAKVIITGRDRQALEKAANELGAVGIVADQGNLKEIANLAQEIGSKFGKIDIVFLNAGIASFSSLENATEEHFDTIMNVNLKGTYFTIQKIVPYLNEGASIILNTSINANIGMPDSSVYAASKAGVLALNRVFATELAPRNIRINAVSPGPVETPLYGKLGLEKEQVEGFGSILAQKILLKRFGQAAEIAKTVAFLASDDASFITGTEIVVDGGLTVQAVV